MTEKQLKQCIREVVKKNFLGKKVKFQTSADEWEAFKVVSYKIRTRKSIGIEQYEYDDYGIDEETEKFIIVEFWDAENKYDVLGCVCCIFTINKKGQIGTCDGPYSFELTVAYDTAIEMVDQIMEEYIEIGKSGLQQIADDLAKLSPKEIELLRFACGNDNPVACIK